MYMYFLFGWTQTLTKVKSALKKGALCSYSFHSTEHKLFTIITKHMISEGSAYFAAFIYTYKYI